MLESQCEDVLRRMCIEVIDKSKQLVSLRGRRQDANEFSDFLSWEDSWHKWDGWAVKKAMDSRMNNVIRDAIRYFWHSEKMLDAYIRKRFGDLPTAMRQTKTFGALFNTFLDDFRGEREAFMDKTNELIAKQIGVLKKQGKMPQSHGGVANLLKVLTATMKAQGSSIKSIAKVQYAICLQAGIYVPEEFITDILVAANIEKDGTV